MNSNIRTFILEEVKKKKSIEEIDEKLCKAYGIDAINYLDLDFWYHKFYNGDYSMEGCRNPNAKQLLDLPCEVFNMILDQLNIGDRFILRRTSQELYDITDTHNMTFKIIKFNFRPLWVSLEVNDIEIRYWKGQNECTMENEQTVLFKNHSYFQMALEDLEFLLESPKLKLQELEVGLRSTDKNIYAPWKWPENRFRGVIERVLQNGGHQFFHVEKLRIVGCPLEFINCFLQYFKPNVLESLDLVPQLYIGDEVFDERLMFSIFKQPQWTEAKKLAMLFGSLKEKTFPTVQELGHFTHICIEDTVMWSLEFEQIRKLIQESQKLETLVVMCGFSDFQRFCAILSEDVVYIPEDDEPDRAVYFVNGNEKVFDISHQELGGRREITFKRRMN
ncbi:unnamed protein product [Caenorhabditis brenneri]